VTAVKYKIKGMKVFMLFLFFLCLQSISSYITVFSSFRSLVLPSSLRSRHSNLFAVTKAEKNNAKKKVENTAAAVNPEFPKMTLPKRDLANEKQIMNFINLKYGHYKGAGNQTLRWDQLKVGSVIKIFYRVFDELADEDKRALKRDGKSDSDIFEKENRVTSFEGIVIKKRGDTLLNKTFTIRRYVGKIGVEQTFPFYSPRLISILVKTIYRVRRKKLYYLRDSIRKSLNLKNKKLFSIGKNKKL
jgi:ribosomal protein L19